MKNKERGQAAVKKKKDIKKAKRFDLKIKAKNCQDISKVFAGMSQNEAVITEKYCCSKQEEKSGKG